MPKSQEHAADRVARELAFLGVADRLKTVIRRSPIMDGSRRENSAEHSWHLAVFALTLCHRRQDINLSRLIELVLVHDLPEIHAGDSPLHAPCVDHVAVAERERRGADALFGLLPDDTRVYLRSLWDEFECGTTPEARVARALDRLQPLLANLSTDGGTWQEAGLALEEVLQRYGSKITEALPECWTVVEQRVRDHFSQKGRGRPSVNDGEL